MGWGPARAYLITRRIELHMSQVDLGARLGVTDATVGRWERGVSSPTVDTLVKWADALEMATTVGFVTDSGKTYGVAMLLLGGPQ